MIRGEKTGRAKLCLVLICSGQVTEVETCLRDKVWRISSILCIRTRKGKPNRYLFSFQQTRVGNTISTVLISKFGLVMNHFFIFLYIYQESTSITAAIPFCRWPLSRISLLQSQYITQEQSHWPTPTLSTGENWTSIIISDLMCL